MLRIDNVEKHTICTTYEILAFKIVCVCSNFSISFWTPQTLMNVVVVPAMSMQHAPTSLVPSVVNVMRGTLGMDSVVQVMSHHRVSNSVASWCILKGFLHQFSKLMDGEFECGDSIDYKTKKITVEYWHGLFNWAVKYKVKQMVLPYCIK